MVVENEFRAVVNRDSVSGKILAGSPVVNLAIPEQGARSLALAATNGYACGKVIYDVYLDLLAQNQRPDRSYVTYDEVADGVNCRIGTDWIDSGHIEKLARTTRYDERIYRLERSIRAWQFLEAAEEGRGEGLLKKVADTMQSGDFSRMRYFEQNRLKTMLRANFLYKGNSELRQFFMEHTAGYLLVSYAQAHPRNDWDFRTNIIRNYFPGFGLDRQSTEYKYHPDHYFPAKLAKSIKLMSAIIDTAVYSLIDFGRSDLLQKPSRLDLMVAEGYKQGRTQEEIQAEIKERILETYADPNDPDIAIIIPAPGLMGHWMSMLTGVKMKANKFSSSGTEEA